MIFNRKIYDNERSYEKNLLFIHPHNNKLHVYRLLDIIGAGNYFNKYANDIYSIHLFEKHVNTNKILTKYLPLWSKLKFMLNYNLSFDDVIRVRNEPMKNYNEFILLLIELIQNRINLHYFPYNFLLFDKIIIAYLQNETSQDPNCDQFINDNFDKPIETILRTIIFKGVVPETKYLNKELLNLPDTTIDLITNGTPVDPSKITYHDEMHKLNIYFYALKKKINSFNKAYENLNNKFK